METSLAIYEALMDALESSVTLMNQSFESCIVSKLGAGLDRHFAEAT